LIMRVIMLLKILNRGASKYKLNLIMFYMNEYIHKQLS